MIHSAADAMQKQALDVLSQPAPWDQLVPSNAIVELEVGSGKGLFLQSAASERPESFFVGIELAVKFANRAAERLANSKLTNTKMLRGDAQAFLRDTVPDNSVSEFTSTFPILGGAISTRNAACSMIKRSRHPTQLAARRRISFLDRCPRLLRTDLRTSHGLNQSARPQIYP